MAEVLGFGVCGLRASGLPRVLPRGSELWCFRGWDVASPNAKPGPKSRPQTLNP